MKPHNYWGKNSRYFRSEKGVGKRDRYASTSSTFTQDNMRVEDHRSLSAVEEERVDVVEVVMRPRVPPSTTRCPCSSRSLTINTVATVAASPWYPHVRG